MGTYSIRSTDLPVRERPASRVGRVVSAASLPELLAAVIGGPQQLEAAYDLIGRYGSLREIARAPSREITRIKGIGPAKVAAVKAALELGRRWLLKSNGDRPRIHGPKDAARILWAEIGSNPERESFWVVCLDRRNHVQEVVRLYNGNVGEIKVRGAEIFREAIRRNSSAIIVAHNHPSGNLSPSPEDLRLTKKLKEVGRALGIEVLDHLILGDGSTFVSLSEEYRV